MALLTTWWWLSQNTILGPKTPKSKHMTFSWRKLASWWNTEWFACTDRKASYLQWASKTLSCTDLFQLRKECFSQSKSLCYWDDCGRAGEATQLAGCLPSMCKAPVQFPALQNQPTRRNPKNEAERKLEQRGKITESLWKGACSFLQSLQSELNGNHRQGH